MDKIIQEIQPKMRFDLNSISEWEFIDGERRYVLNKEEIIRLLLEIKK